MRVSRHRAERLPCYPQPGTTAAVESTWYVRVCTTERKHTPQVRTYQVHHRSGRTHTPQVRKKQTQLATPPYMYKDDSGVVVLCCAVCHYARAHRVCTGVTAPNQMRGRTALRLPGCRQPVILPPSMWHGSKVQHEHVHGPHTFAEISSVLLPIT